MADLTLNRRILQEVLQKRAGARSAPRKAQGVGDLLRREFRASHASVAARRKQ